MHRLYSFRCSGNKISFAASHKLRQHKQGHKDATVAIFTCHGLQVHLFLRTFLLILGYKSADNSGLTMASRLYQTEWIYLVYRLLIIHITCPFILLQLRYHLTTPRNGQSTWITKVQIVILFCIHVLQNSKLRIDVIPVLPVCFSWLWCNTGTSCMFFLALM